jgi:hypothetical protein
VGGELSAMTGTIREYDDKTAGEIYREFLSGKTFAQVGEAYGLSKGQVAGVIYRWRKRVYERDPLPITPLALEGDAIICGDVHVPCTDWAWAGRVVQVGAKLGIRRLIIGGDFFNMDAFSVFSHILPPASWAEERDAARALLGDWLGWFDDIVVLMGNHDRRMEKWAGGNLDEADIFGMVLSNPARVKVSQFGWCTLISNGTPWRITHPRSYGRNQLTVASDLANKFQTNVISFHEHHLSVGWDVYKRWVVVNGGTLVDPAKLAYVQLDDSRAAGMIQGFCAVKRGCVQVFGDEPFSDWACGK